MAWRFRPPDRPPAGILASRRQAEAALLRMLSRARRQQAPLLLLRIAPGREAAGGAAGAGEAPGGDAGRAAAGHQRFLEDLAAELRLGDLAWWEPGGVVLALLEGAGRPQAVLERLQQRARRAGAAPAWRAAAFPEQGLTLEALLEEVQWTR
ncbi:MAG TPA: hypothetical protein VNF74_10995 [Terriglobales bacterium]|nr:hypothetical protein [Terriglobales bacterium]